MGLFKGSHRISTALVVTRLTRLATNASRAMTSRAHCVPAMADGAVGPFYKGILQEAQGLMDGETNWVANCANVASLLFHGLNEGPKEGAVNWAGFYVVDSKKPEELILGPFHGKPACLRIRHGRGVCGTAWATATTQRIADVHSFPGHIACDSRSESEIVIPLCVDGKAVGVLDLDSTSLDCFTAEDQLGLEAIAAAVAKACAW